MSDPLNALSEFSQQDVDEIVAAAKKLGAGPGLTHKMRQFSLDNYARPHGAEVLAMVIVGGWDEKWDLIHATQALIEFLDRRKKAAAFDRLLRDIAQRLPTELAIKKLAGVPLAEALTDFLIVPRSDWESRRQRFRDLLSHLRAYDKRFYDENGGAQLLHALQGYE